MTIEVKVPTLGESITTGILAKWHVADGDRVLSGQILYDLETDKITAEGTAEVAGRVTLHASEGDEVEVGAVIAMIDDTDAATSKKEVPTEAPVETAAAKAEPVSTAHPDSPAVRRIAAETGLDPKSVKGTGKDGRVTKGDMLGGGAKEEEGEKEGGKQGAEKKVEKKATAPIPSGKRTTRKRMTPLRKTIAQRLVAAQQTTAMLTTFNEVDMEPVMNLRKKYQDAFVAKHGVKLGFMSFFTKAVVHALEAVPSVNTQIEGDEIVQNHYYDIGIAVSTPRGLMVPVLRDCEEKGFAQIEQDILDYSQRAKEGKITIEDLQGGVFTITNGGIFGSMLSTPILNQPQSAILGMHTIQPRPVARDDQVVIKPMMYLALSYDHRVIDGREAVTFLLRVKEVLEDPQRLLLGI